MQRGLCIGKHAFGGRVAGYAHRNADAGGHIDLPAAERDRGLQVGEDPIGDRLAVADLAQALQQDGEMIVLQAGDEVIMTD